MLQCVQESEEEEALQIGDVVCIKEYIIHQYHVHGIGGKIRQLTTEKLWGT